MADATETTVADATTKPEGSTTARTYSESEFKELIAQRDAVKNKLREREEADKKASDAKLLEEGKLKDLLTAREKELADLAPLKDKVAKYEAAETAQREKLLKEIPKEKRDLYASVSLEVLQDMVEQLKAKEGTTASKPGSSDADKTFEDFTSEEIQELKAKSPDRYAKLYREFYKKKNGRYPPF
jgi:hypothetical protein